MSKGTLIYLNRFAENLQRKLGEDIAQKVLEGSEAFTETTKLAKVVVLMNAALAWLEDQVDKEQLSDFLHICGVRCAESNLKGALAARARLRAAPSIEAFIDAEIADSVSAFSRIEREGVEVTQSALMGYKECKFLIHWSKT